MNYKNQIEEDQVPGEPRVKHRQIREIQEIISRQSAVKQEIIKHRRAVAREKKDVVDQSLFLYFCYLFCLCGLFLSPFLKLIIFS